MLWSNVNMSSVKFKEYSEQKTDISFNKKVDVTNLVSRLNHERPNMIRDFQANIEAILPLQLVCLEFDVPLISHSLFAATREIVDKSGILKMLTRSSG